jgi:hypothetical protein
MYATKISGYREEPEVELLARNDEQRILEDIRDP